MKRILKAIFSVSFLAVSAAMSVQAQDVVKLRIASHQSPESPSGLTAAQFEKDIEAMSGGTLDLEMFYSASIVKSAETFDAAATGIVDCDMTNGSYQTGKNPAFQFVADVMGGYDTPLEFQAWLNYGGGAEVIDELYQSYGMKYVGSWVGGQESLNSTRPLDGVADLEEFKFRSPPGMESEIFSALGAKPIVMDFTEIFTALETRIIDGADASNIATNMSLGIYDIAKHTTYPGFHSMSSDHLACNLDVWNELSAEHQSMLEVAMQKVALQIMLRVLVDNGEAREEMPDMGVKLYDWSAEDRNTYRDAARGVWDEWAKKTPEAAELVESHKVFIDRIGVGQ